MADHSHLEKMGRELKCPICLSLLTSAVSLACNHVFCNLCITKSMKSASACPVCKVPFHRREVRPAPHMDNLVAVFKSMEVAAGVNILTTQTVPSTKTTGDIEKDSGAEEATITQRGRSKKKRANKSNLRKPNTDTSDPCRPAKPSFPAKKRIQVTPYPVSETPVPSNKAKTKVNDNVLQTSKPLDEDKKIAADRQNDTLTSPFFWLREDDTDEDETLWRPSQSTEDASHPNNVPCFSDLKDSEDDKSPNKMSATSLFNVAEALDSEMFEWTQRACSPELCSTPRKKQNVGDDTLDTVQEKCCSVISGMAFSNEVSHDLSVKSTTSRQENVKDQRNRNLRARKSRVAEKKKTIRARGKHLKKCDAVAPDSLDEVHPEVPVWSLEMAKDSSQEDEHAALINLPSSERRISKRGKEPSNNLLETTDANVAEAPLVVPAKRTGQHIQNEQADLIGILLPVLTRNTTTNDAELNIQNEAQERVKQPASQPKKRHMKLLVENAMTNMLDEVPPENLKAAVSSQVFKSKLSENNKASGNGSSGSVFSIQQKAVEKLTGKRKRKILRVDAEANEIHVALPEVDGCKSNHSDSLASKNLSGSKQALQNCGNHILRQCDQLRSQILCAFCQSSDGKKDSGEMMHYFNGKPVASDYNGGLNLIHSHKYCTEWAPNVYFEDDLAINLSAEVARSRRIKCSCCGGKGAALGCYEKSCRKSFHFTCATLIPECRWDNDNFVMLCPIHASSKLPNETSEPRKRRRRNSAANGELKTPIDCKNGRDKNWMWTWPFGSPCKWVFCCSALTDAEKDIVSEFSRLTGVPISKTWSPAVSHVIASTDGNGACRRTLKFLMGILEGKWIVSVEWIKVSLAAMKPVEEEKYEITVDVHGISGGPRQGRLRIINKEPKLFGSLRFYLAGDFTSKYKGYLHDLVTAAGGTVLHRKPLSKDQEKLFHNSPVHETFIIYSLEMPEKHKSRDVVDFSSRRVEAQALADACGANVATSLWIINSIAACKLQPLA